MMTVMSSSELCLRAGVHSLIRYNTFHIKAKLKSACPDQSSLEYTGLATEEVVGFERQTTPTTRFGTRSSTNYHMLKAYYSIISAINNGAVSISDVTKSLSVIALSVITAVIPDKYLSDGNARVALELR